MWYNHSAMNMDLTPKEKIVDFICKVLDVFAIVYALVAAVIVFGCIVHMFLAW